MNRMSRHETTYFTCNCCKKRDETMPINININLPETDYGEQNFCSFECFRKYFNHIMEEEGFEVEITNE